MRPLILVLPLVLALPAAAQTTVYSGGPSSDAPVTGSEPHSNVASNLTPSDTRSDVAPNLPAPALSPDSKPSDFLRAAQGALATGRTGEVQQSLEMAQSRMLDRSVPLGQTGIPSDNPTVGQISQALHALASHDRPACMQAIETALNSATAQGL